VWDKSQRTDGTFSRDDFIYDHPSDTYRCPAGKTLQRYRRRFPVPRTGVIKEPAPAMNSTSPPPPRKLAKLIPAPERPQ
jgi:hypothetical protein